MAKDQALVIALNREGRRAGSTTVIDKDKLVELLNKPTSVMLGAAFDDGEIIDLGKDTASMTAASIRGGNESFRFMVKTSKGVKAFYLSSTHKRRIPVTDGVVQLDKAIDNYDSEVGKFFEACPSQLIFAAAMAGHKIKASKPERFKAAGFDPNGGPNGTGGTDLDPAHAVNATINKFSFVGQKPTIKDEWLGEDGDEKAAEYLVNYYAENAE